MPKIPVSFDPFRRDMYSRHELFAGFDPRVPQSYAETFDFAVYREYVLSGKYAPDDYFVAMMQALHDNAITQSLRDYLNSTHTKAVGVMGGHKLARNSEPYRNVVYLSRELTRRGFTMLSGGGPGAMEATHLGAAAAPDSDDDVERALASLASQPVVPDLTKILNADGSTNQQLVAAAHAWFTPAYELSLSLRGESLAIPTWLYGHEPSSPFASRIAKYFQNSIREDGLLAVATHGVVYVEGRAGTLQEIFQDAAQNYYRTIDDKFSPMVFLGSQYWSTTIPAIPVLRALFKQEDFERYVLVTDSISEAVAFVETHGTEEDASGRISRYLHHQV